MEWEPGALLRIEIRRLCRASADSGFLGTWRPPDISKADLSEKQREMLDLYRGLFEAEPPASVWPAASSRATQRLGAGGPLPDCCSAKCVKPSCHDCVGCNSVLCGYLAGRAGSHDGVATERRLASPDAFSGYVPAQSPMLERPEPAGYLCSLEWNGPRGSPYSMSLDWTICGESIHFRQGLYGLSAWYSLGLSGKEPHNMGFSDYMLSMFSANYSGVKERARLGGSALASWPSSTADEQFIPIRAVVWVGSSAARGLARGMAWSSRKLQGPDASSTLLSKCVECWPNGARHRFQESPSLGWNDTEKMHLSLSQG